MINGAVYSEIYRSGDARVFWTYKDDVRFNLSGDEAKHMIQCGARHINI